MTFSNYKSANRNLHDEARSHIKWARTQRNELAAVLHTLRSDARKLKTKAERQRVLKIFATHVLRDKPEKPSAENLYREAMRQYEFSQTPLPGIHGSGTYDTDYYSYCGLADAHSMEREDAFNWAQVLYVAAHLMGYRPRSVFEESDDKLSIAASALYRLSLSSDDSQEDLQAFNAPSECYGDVNRGLEKEAREVVKAAGYRTARALERAIGKRVRDRWLFTSRVDHGLALASRGADDE